MFNTKNQSIDKNSFFFLNKTQIKIYSIFSHWHLYLLRYIHIFHFLYPSRPSARILDPTRPSQSLYDHKFSILTTACTCKFKDWLVPTRIPVYLSFRVNILVGKFKFNTWFNSIFFLIQHNVDPPL